MSQFIASFCLLLLLASSSFAASGSPLVLEGAPFSALASWAADVSTKSIIVPDAMTFKVWLRSPSASTSSALSLLRSVAAANGWTLTEKGGLISFVPTVEDKTPLLSSSPPPSVFSPPAPEPPLEYFSAIVPFKNRPASSLVAVAVSLNSLARVSLAPDNSLSISAPLDVLDRLRRDLPFFDTPLTRYRVEAIITEEVNGVADQQGLNADIQKDDGALKMVNVGSSLAGPGVLASLVKIGDFSAIYAFLSSSTQFKIMSTPYILTDDGERGVLHVGDNIPIITGSTIATNGQTLITYNRQDVGIILNVGIKKIGDRVALSIQQEASTVAPSSISGQVVTSNRRVTTNTTVTPGEVIDLGGLVTDSCRSVKTGVPWLRDIPFLGALFRGEVIEKESRTLRVFLRVVLA